MPTGSGSAPCDSAPGIGSSKFSSAARNSPSASKANPCTFGPGAKGQRSDIFELRAVIESLGEVFGPLHAVIAHSLGVMAFVIATRNGVGTNRAVCLSPGLNLDTFIRAFALTLALPEKVTRHLRRRLENFVGADFLQDFWQSLQNVPTLVIHDRDDQEIPWQEGRAMTEALPQGRFTATRGLGHNRILCDSGVIRSAVAFITG